MARDKVREDLEGVVLVFVKGEAVSLEAGDFAPAGVTLGDHVREGGEPTGEPATGSSTAPVVPPPADTAYDPSAEGQGVDEVNNHLASADEAEVARVLKLEAEGKNRKGIVEGPYAPEAQA